ncbi:MAG: hypothetical protein LBL66_03175 [Clostridiales bacterium]|jgi:hypothetical protein|nr:hypothetical protein [Clostridiales bacterium]
MRNKELISNVSSISCVENYFLGWCGEQGIGAGILFNRTYLPPIKILTDFIFGGARFESYGEIPRVMAVAESYGAVTHSAATELDFDGIDAAMAAGSLALTEVNAGFFKGIALKPWRSDHYIWLAEPVRGGYGYLNNYPLSKGSMGKGKLAEVYGGKTLIYARSKTDCVNAAAAIADREKQFCQIARAEHRGFPLPDGADPTALRDAVGVWKITRRRLADWFRAALGDGCEQARLVESLCAELNGFYVWLGASVLRKRFDAGQAQTKLNGILGKEKELSQIVKGGARL